MVSVAMTTFNGEKYIVAQLESLRGQTLPPDEVVIFDDGSTDDTATQVRSFIASNRLNHWRFTVNPSNLGFVHNFYQAIDAASGDYIFLCDQDDVWRVDKIERMIAVFHAQPEIQALNAGFDKIDGQGNRLSAGFRFVHANGGLFRRPVKNGGLVKIGFRDVLWRNISPGCTAAYTRTCRDFFARHRTGLCPHDWELNLFGAVLGGLYFYNVPLTGYRIHGANTIGLVQLKASERLAGYVQDPRTASAEEEYHRACAYGEADWLRDMAASDQKAVERLTNLTERRQKAFSQRETAQWFALLGCLPDYWRWRGPQGILNDLRYIKRPGR